MSRLFHKDGTTVTVGDNGTVTARSGPDVTRYSFPTFIAVLNGSEVDHYYIDDVADLEKFLAARNYRSVTL